MTALFDSSFFVGPEFGKLLVVSCVSFMQCSHLAVNAEARGWSSHGLAEHLSCHTTYFFPSLESSPHVTELSN